jgi:hypothetical protein
MVGHPDRGIGTGHRGASCRPLSRNLECRRACAVPAGKLPANADLVLDLDLEDCH